MSTVLTGLNDAQRTAVTRGEGPLLVIAGAGTGKTTVLTRRIAWLAASGQVEADHILALTFTERAAGEMAGRVTALLPQASERPWIGTFHAFGEFLLRQEAARAGLPAGFRVLSAAQQLAWIRERLFALPLHYYRPAADPARYVRALAQFFSRLKDEDVTPEQYMAYAESCTEAAGDPAALEAAGRQLELAHAYRAYQDALASSGAVDFGDLLVGPLRLLRADPDALRRWQQRFPAILIDEFQDTNVAQFALVQLLAAGRRHVTAVADDDQSLYAWRGAALDNLLGFRTTYPDARTVTLTENYRSSQATLDAAHRLIRHNDPHRLEASEGVDKRLVGRPDGCGPAHLHFATREEEAAGVADLIARGAEAPDPDERWAYRDVAILVRANADADPFMRALAQRSIPFWFSGGAGLYDREEVRTALAFLRSLADPRDGLALFGLATSAIYRIPVDLAAALLRAAAVAGMTLEALIESPLSHDAAALVDAQTQKALAAMAEDLAEAREDAQTLGVADVLARWLDGRTGYLPALREAADSRDRMAARALETFVALVREYASASGHLEVRPFARYLDALIASGDDPGLPDPPEEFDGVRVLTVHKAKGLEFPVVFVVSCVGDRFPTRRRSDPIPLPDEVLRTPPRLSAADAHLHEERRAFYVAMTRSQRALYLTSASDYGGARPKKVSRFVSEALGPVPNPAPLTRRAVANAPTLPPPATTVAAGGPPVFSFSQVDDYVTCPLRYRYAHVLRLMRPASHRAGYGMAIHAAIRCYHERRAAGLPVTVEDVVAAYDEAWTSDGFLCPEHEAERKAEGREALARFVEFESAGPSWTAMVERSFMVEIEGVPIRGRWDRIDTLEQGAVIVDYKTSDVRTVADATQRAKESLQLGIYALAHCAAFGEPPVRMELRFPTASGVVVGAVEPTPALLGMATEAIVATARGVAAGRFAPTPDAWRACRTCPFAAICPATTTAEP